MDINFLTQFVEETVLSSLSGLGTLAEVHFTIYTRIYFGFFCSIPLVVFVFMPVPYYFDYCSFVVGWEMRT